MSETVKRDSEYRSIGQILGILATVLSLPVAVIALIVTIFEIKESRKVNEATMFTLAMERLSVARKIDQMDSDKRDAKRATRRIINEDGEIRSKCSGKGKQLSARAGQIPVLERMAHLKPSLRDIVAPDVNLVYIRSIRDNRWDIRGINLENADLSRAYLRNTNLRNALLSNAILTDAVLGGSCLEHANLSDAHLQGVELWQSDLSRANLSGADFTRADLYQVNFSGANFTNATLTDADISGADFTGAEGLKQPQLDSACALKDIPPVNLKKVKGKKLNWNPKDCK